MTEYLAIGGSRDGEVILIAGDTGPTVEFPIYEAPVPHAPILEVKTKTDVYVRVALDDGMFILMHESFTTLSDALKHLREGYAQSKAVETTSRWRGRKIYIEKGENDAMHVTAFDQWIQDNRWKHD